MLTLKLILVTAKRLMKKYRLEIYQMLAIFREEKLWSVMLSRTWSQCRRLSISMSTKWLQLLNKFTKKLKNVKSNKQLSKLKSKNRLQSLKLLKNKKNQKLSRLKKRRLPKKSQLILKQRKKKNKNKNQQWKLLKLLILQKQGKQSLNNLKMYEISIFRIYLFNAMH